MCIRLGNDELESVKNLMGMSLMAVVAEALDVELEELHEESRLVEDLHMDGSGERRLTILVAEIFDGLEVDMAGIGTVGELLEVVVSNEFADLGGGTEEVTVGQIPQLLHYPKATAV